MEVFQLKYDYHNAKVLIKAQAMGLDEARLLSQGGRYDPQRLREDFLRDDLRDWGEVFRQAVLRAREVLSATGDPQQADLVLDRACFQEMESLARACGSAFLQGYVRLSVDAANLRAAVRAARMGKGSEFLNQILLPGGNVSERALAGARPEELAERFRSGPLAQAAALGAARTQPDSGPLTEFERLCDNAVTGYLASASRVPFGEETVIGYLYAREAEITAVRIIMAGRTGSSYAATLGTMQVNEEIDALKTLGIKISDYLVTPRLVSLVVTIPFLTLLADALGILGGAVVGVSFLDLSSPSYFDYSIKALSLKNILVGLMHSVVYGIIISLCGCYEGLNAGRDADSVGKATTGAVVTALVWMIVATGVLTVILEEMGI